MYCETEKHIICIDTDCEYTCKKCRCIFVERERVNPLRGSFSKLEMNKCLKFQNRKFWMIEKYKLDAIRSIVMKMKLGMPTKSSVGLRLEEYPVYTWEDFSLPIPEFIEKYVEEVVHKI